MKKKYHLLNKKGIVMPITISEDFKEDFKDLMSWSEEDFKTNTCTQFIRDEEKEQ